MRKAKHVFSEKEREQWVKWKKQKQEEQGSHPHLENLLKEVPNAPSLRAICGWEKLQNEGHSLETHTSEWGRPSMLTEGEKAVIAGWVLKREALEKVTQARDVIEFFKKHFSMTVSKQWVSTLLHSLGFSSQRVKTSKAKVPIIKRMPEMKNFILQVRELIEDGVELSRIVAMDEVMFWNCGTILRSYAVCGG